MPLSFLPLGWGGGLKRIWQGRLTPTLIATGVESVAAGYQFALALDSTGRVLVWG